MIFNTTLYSEIKIHFLQKIDCNINYAIGINFYIFLLFTINLFAKESPRGELSAQFCNSDCDMLADTPSNPKEWINPYTLVFGLVPSQSFVFAKGSREPLRKHIEKITGKKVEIFPYKTNAAELEAMALDFYILLV